jgi:hypothetical protein
MAFWGTRSPFYSMLFYVIAQIFSLWRVLVAQTAVIGWLIWRATTHAGRERCFELDWQLLHYVPLDPVHGYMQGSPCQISLRLLG